MTTLATPEVRRLLDFAARSRVDGGFGYLCDDGNVDQTQPVHTWITARMTHVFSLAVLLGDDRFRGHAAHGVHALSTGLRDQEYGGWFTGALACGQKLAYDHAFVLLAAASASMADVPAAAPLLEDALSVWKRHFWDNSAGAVVDEWDRTWTVCDSYRGANANMHTVEALLAAADATGDEALATAANRIVHQFLDFARDRNWRLPEHYDPDWRVVSDYNVDEPAHPFRPYGVTVGHQFEWSRLALAAGAPLDDAVALYRVAKERGWAADGHDGFVYTLDWDDTPVVTSRMHWVLAEAIAAAAVLGTATGQADYDHDLALWQQHARSRFHDDRTGNWHHELTPTGHLSTSTWQGQPDAYHVIQSLLLPELPLARSLAAALLLRRSHVP